MSPCFSACYVANVVQFQHSSGPRTSTFSRNLSTSGLIGFGIVFSLVVGEILLSVVPMCAMLLVFVLTGINGKEDDKSDP